MRGQTLMIIRHGEKATDPEPYRGMDEHGNHDQHSLTIRGWQRAGALPHVFVHAGRSGSRLLPVPTALFACAVTPLHPSRRCEQTLGPLSRQLGAPIRLGYSKGDEAALAATLRVMHDDVLVCWEHKMIPVLARLLAPGQHIPAVWPENRFDVIWVIHRDASGRIWFSQQAQQALPGDSSHGIEHPYEREAIS